MNAFGLELRDRPTRTDESNLHDTTSSQKHINCFLIKKRKQTNNNTTKQKKLEIYMRNINILDTNFALASWQLTICHDGARTGWLSHANVGTADISRLQGKLTPGLSNVPLDTALFLF